MRRRLDKMAGAPKARYGETGRSQGKPYDRHTGGGTFRGCADDWKWADMHATLHLTDGRARGTEVDFVYRYRSSCVMYACCVVCTAEWPREFAPRAIFLDVRLSACIAVSGLEVRFGN